MRICLFTLVLVLSILSSAFAVDVSDLGVPNGWKADNYDEQGHKLLNKGDYETAKRYFTAAIRVKPDHWGAYYNRAMAFATDRGMGSVLTIDTDP
jgi:tetratricopeptide (TPR) repeat protein